jgi:large subunit ribosomal protein L25
MSGEIIIEAEKRGTQGTGEARRMRHKGTLPAIMYGSGVEPVMLQINEHDFVQMMRKHASEYLMVDLKVDGGDVRKALVKEVQHHPVTGNVLHVDFQAVSMTETIAVDVTVELVGEPVGVVEQAGVLEHLLRTVEIESLPSDIIESVRVDVSAMNIGDRLTVGDIELDKDKYTVITAPEVAIAAVMPPRVAAAGAESDEASEEGEGGEGASEEKPAE